MLLEFTCRRCHKSVTTLMGVGQHTTCSHCKARILVPSSAKRVEQETGETPPARSESSARTVPNGNSPRAGDHKPSMVNATSFLCPYCEADVSATALKCKHCGEWIRSDPRSASTPPPKQAWHHSGSIASAPTGSSYQAHGATNPRVARRPPPPVSVQRQHQAAPAPHPQQVVVKMPESPTFAIITFVLYLFVFPLGALLNLIGLLTGPKRGCFLAMLLFFIVIPVVVILALGLSVAEVLGSGMSCLRKMFPALAP